MLPHPFELTGVVQDDMVSQERVGESQGLLCAGQQVQKTYAGTGESVFVDGAGPFEKDVHA
jgi:hypothetical protein